MWKILRFIAQLLNKRILGPIDVGTLLVLAMLIAGAWLLIISEGQALRIVLGAFLLAVALGFFLSMFSRRSS